MYNREKAIDTKDHKITRSQDPCNLRNLNYSIDSNYRNNYKYLEYSWDYVYFYYFYYFQNIRYIENHKGLYKYILTVPLFKLVSAIVFF